VAGTIQDITDLRRAEAALRRSEQSLANAQRIARIGSWRWDAATDSVAWSREVFRILGFDPDATTPTLELFLSRVHPEDRDGLVKVIEASLRDATSCSIDYRLVLPDGSIRHVHEQAEVLCDAEGHVVCRNGTIQDVTPRKQEEEALRRAKRAAEAAVQAKSRFLANMSHELRTPLNAIIGFSEVMANEMLGPLGAAKYAVYARDILDSGRRLLSVINDILEMSRIETGAVQLRESRIEFDAIAAAALQRIEQRAADVGLTLVKDVPPDMPPVLADERLIRQATINLLSNAVKFTPAGGRVALRAGLASDGGAWLAVADTGIGIAPESIATALEPFGQVDSSLSRRYEGTGLGLPLVSSIVELHQGSMAIDSAVGAGTTVTMKLPPSRTIGINTRCAPENSTAPSATRNR
jgi:PAS domain S-box-containing protein